ncbi:Fumarylacetoacetase (EC [Olavius sp. associated proteobacterium Delta 1]|nr:Fumarylacetoacetase (EC [Olavius sp. associated proteobacterium Delta 1]
MTGWEYAKGLHPVKEGVYAYLVPPGLWGNSNCGLIVDGGESLVVDTRYDLELTGEMLKSMETVPGAVPVNYLVNTHIDGDHIFGNQLLKDAEIIASKTCTKEFKTEITPQGYAEILENAPNLGKFGQYFIQTFSQFHFEGIDMTPPTRSFENRMELKIGNKEINLIEVGPAHTKGDSMVYIPGDKVLFAGDVVISTGAPVSWEGPLDSMIKALDLILSLDVEVLVPGHGPLGDKSAAQKNKDYWEYTAGEAIKFYDQGMPAVEAAERISATGRYRSEQQAILNIINIHMLYRDISGDQTPPDKPGIFGQIAEMVIPD